MGPPDLVTAATVLASIARVADSSAPVEETQLAGTDNPPTWLAEAKFADTPPAPKVLLPAAKPPRCRPANCGVGNHAPAAPAVVPRPWNVCCPILQPKLPRPTP